MSNHQISAERACLLANEFGQDIPRAGLEAFVDAHGHTLIEVAKTGRGEDLVTVFSTGVPVR